MGYFSRKMEIIKKRVQWKCYLKTLTEVVNSFDRLISRLNIAKKRFSELEEVSIKIIQTKTQKDLKSEKI